MPGRNSQNLWWLPLAALACGLALLFSPLNEPIANFLFDRVAPQLPASGPAPRVLVVDIDNASLRELEPRLGRWPYRRDVYALAVETLREAGARAIGIDLLFADAHDGDAALARAIAVPGAPVVLGAAALTSPMATPAAPSPSRARAVGGETTLALPTRSLWPTPEQAPRLGIFTSPLDADGRLRRIPLWYVSEGRLWPSFPLALWQATAASGAAPAWPRDESGRVAQALSPRSPSLPVMPFAELMRVALDQSPGRSITALSQRVRDHVVVLGSSAALGDGVQTSAGQVSGTMVLAQAFAQLRDGQVPSPPSWPQHSVLMAMALVPALRTWRRGHAVPWNDGLAALAAALAVLAAGAVMLLAWQWQSQWAAPLAAVVAGLVLSLWVHHRQNQAAQRWMAREREREAAANRAKSAFLADVSHEIRTPMNALLGVAELLARTELDPAQRRHVDVFRSAGQTLSALLDELLDLSKIESGRVDLRPAPFDLLALLEGQMALQRPRAEARGLHFELVLAPGLPSVVLGDAQRLGQALTNLLSNAIKFTSDGSVSLRVSNEAVTSNLLLFVVSDTGVGIAEDRLDAVFDPFTQADASIAAHFGGTGLGLSITRSLARLMGGMVTAQSTPGLGSIFELRLPLPASRLPTAAPRAASFSDAAVPTSSHANGALPHRPQARPLTLLLAEDNEVNAYLFEAMLADRPCEIVLAGNGQEALLHFKAQAFDAVFMDVQMPLMDGLAATREIRRLEAQTGQPPVPIVALTAHAYSSDMQASLAAGCDAHLAKPVSKAQLLQVLDRIALGLPPGGPPTQDKS